MSEQVRNEIVSRKNETDSEGMMLDGIGRVFLMSFIDEISFSVLLTVYLSCSIVFQDIDT